MAHLSVDRGRVIVLGPAYLDRVIRVDRPLVDPTQGSPLDQSIDGSLRFGSGLRIVDEAAGMLDVQLPPGWPGPEGIVTLSRPLLGSGERQVAGVAWHDDLGGMGAGYAAAFGASLVSALGPDDDPTSQAIRQLLESRGIAHSPVHVAGTTADWTLLISSGPYGDKLPIGFRGCHSSWTDLPWELAGSCQLRIVAALPNRLAEQALRAPGAKTRVFAPAMRNVLDRERPIEEFADVIDLIACNRQEWQKLAEPQRVDSLVAVVSVTDGPAGGSVRYTDPQGERCEYRIGAFPRARPPRDTNRAGEAYAWALLSSLCGFGWAGGSARSEWVEAAAQRASAAAALVLDRTGFGFPTLVEVEATLRHGRVE